MDLSVLICLYNNYYLEATFTLWSEWDIPDVFVICEYHSDFNTFYLEMISSYDL